MRAEQRARLEAIQEDLIDVFAFEVDHKQWPGDGMSPLSMTKDTRGDRYWCKKNAAATIGLITRVSMLLDRQAFTAAKIAAIAASASDDEPADETIDPPDDDIDQDKDIARVEREAKRLIERVRIPG